MASTLRTQETASIIWEIMKGNWKEWEDLPRSARTKKIFFALSKIRKSIYPTAKFFASKRKVAHRSEYLVDLCWPDGYPRKGTYRGLFLAMESEMETGGSWESRWWDFVKLADINADLKVFLGRFGAGQLAAPNRFIDEAKGFLSKHRHSRKDQLLLILLAPKGKPLCGWLINGIGIVLKEWGL